MKKSISVFIGVLVTAAQCIYAQDSAVAAKQDIDPSKPTNLYTQVNANLEYQAGKNQNLFGVRANIQYAVNPDNLFLIELPFLYNDRTSRFGVGDMRVRYFNAVKRNISKSFIAIAPFADISVPIGSYKNGLGASNWSLASGVVFGFIVSKKLSLFPGVNYVHLTKPSTSLIPEVAKYSSDGVGFQFNASYVINKTTFLFVNPVPVFLSTGDSWKSVWSGEVNLNKIIKPNKLKMNIGWYPNFTAEVHTIRLGATMYL